MSGCAECTDEGTGPCVHGCRISRFMPGARVEVHEVPGGYVVFPTEGPTRYESHTWNPGEDDDECIVCGVTWGECEEDCGA